MRCGQITDRLFSSCCLWKPPQSGLRASAACNAVKQQSVTVTTSSTSKVLEQQQTSSCVTLVTQCSLDRWPRFQQQAESWGGPVSVAVYIPAPQHTATAHISLQLLQQWVAQHTAQHPTQQLHVTALFANHYAREGASALINTATEGTIDLAALESTQSGDPPRDSIPFDQLYPINALRNLALHHASTPLVLPVDADFMFSQGLEQQLHAADPGYSLLSQPAAHLDTAVDSGQVSSAQGAPDDLSLVDQLLISSQQPPSRPLMLVLPAFQLVTGQQQQQQGQQGTSAEFVADTQRVMVPSTKPELLLALQQGSVRPFDCGVFAPKEQPLDIADWCSAAEPLELQYVDLFEVHGGIALKQQLPPYSEAFRGYGLNKQQHAWHAAALGFTFKVLPDAFMVTAPHKRSSSWRPLPGTAADAAHLARISGVYAYFKQQLAQQGLVPRCS